MLRRIHVYAASLGLLLAGPAVAVDQSSEAVMLDRASAAAAELPTFELMGFPITRHQVALLGAAQIRERSPNSHTHAGRHASLSPPGGGLVGPPKADRGADNK